MRLKLELEEEGEKHSPCFKYCQIWRSQLTEMTPQLWSKSHASIFRCCKWQLANTFFHKKKFFTFTNFPARVQPDKSELKRSPGSDIKIKWIQVFFPDQRGKHSSCFSHFLIYFIFAYLRSVRDGNTSQATAVDREQKPFPSEARLLQRDSISDLYHALGCQCQVSLVHYYFIMETTDSLVHLWLTFTFPILTPSKRQTNHLSPPISSDLQPGPIHANTYSWRNSISSPKNY